jgi:hypothetical protein
MSRHYSSPYWAFPHGDAAGPHRSVCGTPNNGVRAVPGMRGPSRHSSQLRFWQRERSLFSTSSLRMARKSFMKKLDSVYVPQYV